jgi:apolipoprotein N-acyltransferase
VQWYELTGALGGSLWVLLTNVLLFELILNRKRRGVAVATGFVALVPIVASLIIGAGLEENEGAQKATVTVVQPNIDPYKEKYSLPTHHQLAIFRSLIEEAPEEVDFIVLPETVIGDSGNIIWEHKHLDNGSVQALERVRSERYPRAQIISGAMTSKVYRQGESVSRTARNQGGLWYDRYNTALALDGDSTLKVSHKSRLVVGVEKMPYMNLLKPLEKLIVNLGGTTGELGTDKYRRLFLLRNDHFPYGVSVAAPICYESVYGDHFGAFAADGAEIMMVITNDGWWHDTEGYRQHFSYSRLRAIETRRWVCRAANTGISGFISPSGEVVKSLGWDERGVLTHQVTPSRKVTLYAKAGDYLGRLGTYLWILSLLYYVSYRFRRRSHLVK